VTFTPAFNALCRETAIAAEQIASGVTLLGRASGSAPGIFGQALFSLSIGFERLAKLIFVVKHYVDHSGQFPSDETLKNTFRHRIQQLFDYSVSLAPRYLNVEEYGEVPASDIHQGVVASLNEFAGKTRYFNLSILSGPVSGLQNPSLTWYAKVSKPILDKHYRRRERDSDESLAGLFGPMFDSTAVVAQTGEDGGPIDNGTGLFSDRARVRVIQKWSGFYVLQLARFLSAILDGVENEARQSRSEDIPAFGEFTMLFRNDDRYLKSRKTWSIYRP
jgi:hypothetical protein